MAYCTTDWYVSNRVGIGTDAPEAPLNIRCDSSSSSAFLRILTCAGNSGRRVDINAGNGIEYTIPAGTSQSPYIQVEGGVPEFGGGSFKIRTGASGTGAADRLIVTQAGNVDIQSGGVLSLLRSDNGRKGCLFADGSGTKLSSDATGNDPLFLIAPGASAQIRMQAGGSTAMAIGASSVGIGTTTPSSRLDVCGADGRIQSRVDSSDGSTINVRPNAGKCGWISYTEDAVADRWGIGIKNGDAKLYFASGNVGVGGGTTRMVLDSNGKVGIGTTSGNGQLTVSVDQSSNNQHINIVGTQTSYSQEYSLGIPTSTKDFRIYDGTAGATRFTLTSAGKVGIGTTSPTPFFQVCGNQSSENVAWVQNTNSNGYGSLRALNDTNTAAVFGVGGSAVGTPYANNGYLYTDPTVNFVFAMGGAERMRILCTGNVGINTASPSYRLHVNGTFYAAGSSLKYKEGICNYDTNSCLFMCLKPVTYQYKDEFKHLGKELKSETQIGLIAEHVAEVMPELAILVNEEDEKVVRNVDYEKLSIVLLAEVQKLRKEVDQLKQSC